MDDTDPNCTDQSTSLKRTSTVASFGAFIQHQSRYDSVICTMLWNLSTAEPHARASTASRMTDSMVEKPLDESIPWRFSCGWNIPWMIMFYTCLPDGPQVIVQPRIYMYSMYISQLESVLSWMQVKFSSASRISVILRLLKTMHPSHVWLH